MLSVSLQRKYSFYHQNTLLGAFRTNSRNIIGRKPSMVIPFLANQDLTPMLVQLGKVTRLGGAFSRWGSYSRNYGMTLIWILHGQPTAAGQIGPWRVLIRPAKNF